MISFSNLEIYGFEPAIRGMRNPKNSWDKSDSVFCMGAVSIGDSDLFLMKNLFKSGTDHRKFMRMIAVWVDIEAPLYWWKEFDTYKVGTVANSCSTMHKITSRHLTENDFSMDSLEDTEIEIMKSIINQINYSIDRFNETKDKKYFDAIVRLLPTSYMQRRTIMLNYEVIANMVKSRSSHKLLEWREFCKYVRKNLPYFSIVIDDNAID